MNLTKTTLEKGTKFAGLLVIFSLGVVVGKIVTDFPLIQFKKEIDFSAIVSFGSLVAAIYFIPFVVNKYLAARDSTNAILVADMDEVLKKLEEIGISYRELHLGGQPLSENDWKLLMMRLRTITNLLDMLAKQFDQHPALKSFRQDVFSEYTSVVHPGLTANIVQGHPIEYTTYLDAAKSMETITARLRQYRYMVFTK